MRSSRPTTTLTNLDPAAVASVAWRCRSQDWQEITATVAIEDPAIWAQAICARAMAGAVAWSAETPAAVVAAAWTRPGVLALSMFATNDWPHVAAAVTRWCHRSLRPTLLRAGAHRAECQSLSTHAVAHRWLTRFGFVREAVMPGWGKRRETFVQFAWVLPDVLLFDPAIPPAASAPAA